MKHKQRQFRARPLKNALFPRFRLSFVSCFVHSSLGRCKGKTHALPLQHLVKPAADVHMDSGSTVVGLYPNIPHDEGLEAMRKILNKRINQEIPTAHIVDLVELVLKTITLNLTVNILKTWYSNWYQDGTCLR